MKRLGIFVFYEKDGIVDRYVQYLLETMREHVAYMVAVCNGVLTEQGRQSLREFADELYLRENTGYDAMALKMALTEYIGWEKVMSYDEVIFFNDTFYGPIYPWREVFDAMEQREIDFWGLTGAAESADYFSYYEKKVPAYIQSFFYAFRHKVLCHPKFQEYWNRFDSTDWIFSDVTNKHEKIFTHFLEEQGFLWDTYVKAELFESTELKQNFVQYYYIASQLIKEYRCPIIKRKNFIMQHLTENPGEMGNDTAKALEYIEKYTDYDVNLIWDNLLRLYRMQDIGRTLNLNYIVPDDPAVGTVGETALLLCLFHKECLPRCLAYIERLDREMPVYLYSDSVEILETAQAHLRERTIEYEDISKKYIYSIILKKCQELAEHYSYLIFLQDVDYYDAGYFRLQQYSLLEHLWGNLLEDQNHVTGMEALFRQHERLGMLVAPQPFYGTYFSSIGEGKNQFLAFCYRGEAVRKVFAKDVCSGEEPYIFTEDEFMEILSLKLQRAGYYTAAVMRTDYAATAYSQMQALLGRMLQQAKRNYEFSDFDSYLDGEVAAYAARFPRVMVYGAGENGYRAACLLKNRGLNFEGFLVSDGQPHGEEKYGYPVVALSELEDKNDLGVVISVASEKAQKTIIENLKGCGIFDVCVL